MRKGRTGWIAIGLTAVGALIAAAILYPIGAPTEQAAGPATKASAGPTTLKTNAAERYYTAAGELERLQNNSADMEQFGRYEETGFDAGAAAFFEKYKAILEDLRAAALADGCDWGSPTTAERLESLNRWRSLMGFVLLHAEFAKQQGDTASMVDDITASMTLARHVGSEGLLVTKLVEIGMENKSIDRLAASLGVLTPDQLRSLQTRLEKLPPSVSGKQMMQAELEFAKKSIREQQGGMIVTAMADSLEGFYGEIGAVMDQQSPAEFAKTVDAALARNNLNQFAQISGPSFARAREPMAMLQAKWEMLRAAIDIRLNDEAALARWRDPFGQGPFTLTPTESGFELSSSLTTRGAPVKLVVGGK